MVVDLTPLFSATFGRFRGSQPLLAEVAGAPAWRKPLTCNPSQLRLRKSAAARAGFELTISVFLLIGNYLP